MNKRRSKHLIWIFIAMFALAFFIPENLDAGTKKNIRIGKYWKPYADSGDEGEGNIGWGTNGLYYYHGFTRQQWSSKAWFLGAKDFTDSAGVDYPTFITGNGQWDVDETSIVMPIPDENGYTIRSYLRHQNPEIWVDGFPLHDPFFGREADESVDPAKIDVNIHPTKTEIKFEDERNIYSIIRAAIKHSLGQYNIAPSIDFSLNPDYQVPITSKGRTIKTPNIEVDPNFNPFEQQKSAIQNKSLLNKTFSKGKHWEAIFEEIQEDMNTALTEGLNTPQSLESELNIEEKRFAFQVDNRFILTQIKSGILIVDQQRAHQRILYEQYFKSLQNKRPLSQQLVFPHEIHLSPTDIEIFKEITDDIESVGFDINIPTSNCLMILGVPFETKANEIDKIIDNILDAYKNQNDAWKSDHQKFIAKSLALSNAIKNGKTMASEEMNELIDSLFACELPFISIYNKPTAIVLEINELIKRFR